jgi:hypothetical protein
LIFSFNFDGATDEAEGNDETLGLRYAELLHLRENVRILASACRFVPIGDIVRLDFLFVGCA